MLSSLLRCTRTATAAGRRHLGVACKSPHPDPLHLLQKECIDRQLCNTDGNRLPGVDWRFSIGIADAERPAAVRVRTNAMICHEMLLPCVALLLAPSMLLHVSQTLDRFILTHFS